MVRSSAGRGATRSSCPHASGDGPLTLFSLSMKTMLSPRVWGWSVECGRGGDYCHVVPTRVGMVRTARVPRARSGCCPHACGDGPTTRSPARPPARLSPRVWGWSGSSMVERRSPKLSPRVWGWSANRQRHQERFEVVPTRVGMVRRRSRTFRPSTSCPHASGDGPRHPAQPLHALLLSPREWGWTVWTERVIEQHVVVPTRVGMDRCRSAWCRRRWRCPHASGDGPRLAHQRPRPEVLSPRVWGWSERPRPGRLRDQVVPTRVGMVRRPSRPPPPHPRCPHASGDGPWPVYGVILPW